jgi:hypothetical protein
LLPCGAGEPITTISKINASIKRTTGHSQQADHAPERFNVP